MNKMYLTFHQMETIPHKESVHVRDQERRIGFIEYQISRASYKPWLLILPGVQERFNTLRQARDYALKHITRVYSKVECEN